MEWFKTDFLLWIESLSKQLLSLLMVLTPRKVELTSTQLADWTNKTVLGDSSLKTLFLAIGLYEWNSS